MPFFLDGNPTQSEISEAVNYLLGNFTTGLSSDVNTGQIIAPDGNIVGYIYQYIAVKYADSFDGSVNFSDLPTNREYYGLRNSNDAAESSNPTDYIWSKVTGGFGTTKFLWYQTTGGRAIQFQVATSAPDAGWYQDTGASIDLDTITSATVPVIAESFVSYFTPPVMQVPRSGDPLTPVFTNVNAAMFATDKGVVIPFSDAQTDSNVGFVNNSWRIGNSSTTGFIDISYTNITVGNPTDSGDFALWPEPTAMSANPAYITVPVRYKDSFGTVTQASVAKVQFAFADPGALGPVGSSVDISGYTSFVQNSGGVFTPANATLTALLSNVTSPTYSWAISGATPTTATTASVVVTPTSSATNVTVTLTVNGSNLLTPISKTFSMPVVYDGAPGTAGANGVMSAFPTIYIWTGSSTPPTRPSTTSTFTWSTGAYTAPAGWSTSAPSNTIAGNYLWTITVPLNASATTTTSILDWTNTTYPIRAVAYNGANGANGTNGTNGTNGAAGAATFVITRVANDSSPPTNSEVSSLLGRNPVAGDICTVSYNSSNNAVVYRYVTSWTLFTTYITGSLIVQNTITGDKIAANTINGDRITAGSITADRLSASYVQVGGSASDINSGTTTINGGKITANSITVDQINNVATGQIIAGSFNFVSFTTVGSTTFTIPDYVYKIKITCIGAGGGAGSRNGGGGGGGGGSIGVFSVTPGTNYTVTVGSGGASTGQATGAAGTASSVVGGLITIVANGGGGATAVPGGGGDSLGGVGGTSYGGNINITGGYGWPGSPFTGAYGSGGAAAFIGTNMGSPGVSASPNSGGGGCSNYYPNNSGGSGGSGLVIIEY